MTARTPLATLTLARDYLDSLLERSTPGPWTAVRVPELNFAAIMPPVLSDYSDGGEGLIDPPDAYLIVALHATVPAIRELLAAEHDSGSVNGHTLRIAAAILSTSHAAQWITDREAK